MTTFSQIQFNEGVPVIIKIQKMTTIEKDGQVISIKLIDSDNKMHFLTPGDECCFDLNKVKAGVRLVVEKKGESFIVQLENKKR